MGDFSRGMAALIGHPAEEAFQLLGYPDQKLSIGDNIVYRWGTDQPFGPSCTFKIVVAPDGRIKSWDGLGNSAGCSPYGKTLKRWQKGR
jgi:hypothetical protein